MRGLRWERFWQRQHRHFFQRERIHRSARTLHFSNRHFAADSQRRLSQNPLRILDSKDERDKKFLPNAPKIVDYLDDESRENFKTITDMLEQLGINYVMDDDLVRGLDYYTGIIFEFMVEDKNLWESATTDRKSVV